MNAHVAMRHDVAADVTAAVSQTFGKPPSSRLRQQQQADMLEDKRAQDHHASAQLVCLTAGIEITHSRHLLVTLAVDAEYLRSSSEVEVAGF